MVRVLVLSAIFPNHFRPNLGIFVESQVLALAGEAGMGVRVVAPVAQLPFPLRMRPGERWREALPRSECWKGVRVDRPRWTRLPRLRRFDPARQAAALLPFLARLRQDFPFDVISAEWFWPDGPVAMRIGRAMGVPFLVKARGDDVLLLGANGWARPQLREAAASAGQVLAVSAGLRERMGAIGIPAERIAVHHTGVDRELFRLQDKAAAKAKLGVTGPLLLTVGGLTARKNQALALEALAQVDDATLLLAGGGPDRAALEAKARSLGVDRRVRFLGSVPHAQMAGLYAAADVTVSASHGEGLANAWVESLACGTPVVTGNAEGAREALGTPEAGRIVAHEPAAIAAAVLALLASPPDRDRVCAAAAGFSWERNAAELAAHLRRIAS